MHLFTAAGAGGRRQVTPGESSPTGSSVATLLQGRCLPYGETIVLEALSEALRDAGLPEPGSATSPFRRSESSSSGSHTSARWWCCSTTSTGPRPRSPTSSRPSPSPRAAHRSCSCASRARPSSTAVRAGGGGRLNASSVLLEPLGETESSVSWTTCSKSDLDESIRDYVLSTAEGKSALLVEELLATLVDRDVLHREAGRWTTTEGGASAPADDQGAHRGAHRSTSDGERTVLELAAVGGRRTFHRDICRACTGRAPRGRRRPSCSSSCARSSYGRNPPRSMVSRFATS